MFLKCTQENQMRRIDEKKSQLFNYYKVIWNETELVKEN